MGVDQVDKFIKQEPGVQRAAACLWMELDGEDGTTGVVHALAGAVIGIGVTEHGAFGQGIGYDGVAVVLGGDEYTASGNFLHGLVGAAVAVVQFFGFGAHGQSHQLMAQTNAEYRNAAVGNFLQLVDDSGVFRRIARAVAEHNTVGVIGEHFFGGGGAGHTDDFTAAADQFAGECFLWRRNPTAPRCAPRFPRFRMHQNC